MDNQSGATTKQQRYINFFWVTLTVVITICTIIVSISTLTDMFRTRALRSEVERKIAILERNIEEDSIFIERISNDPEFMEKYARETFHMQRRGETVYILEE
jgi:cell division protein FtsB